MKKIRYLTGAVIFLLFILIYFLTSAGNTPYDYFVRLADAFLSGRYWLVDPPAWLNETIPGNGKNFVVYPPMPAILLIPVVMLFGIIFPQQILAHALGAGIVLVTIKIAYSISKDAAIAVWSGLLIGLGSILWFMSATGSVWYLGQITAVFFILCAINESLNKKRGLLIGVFLGAAVLSRVHLIITLPFFLLFTYRPKYLLQRGSSILAGLAPFVIFYALYNYVRFGSPLQTGYTLIPGILSESWYSKGLIHPSYIISHLKLFLTKLPIFTASPPYLKPSWGGLAIWITTPAFIYAFSASVKEKNVILTWTALIAIALVVFSHGATGFTQFGHRYAVDFYPFLLLLTIYGVSKTNLKWIHWFLLALSIIVNLWGVLWINKFHWVSF